MLHFETLAALRQEYEVNLAHGRAQVCLDQPLEPLTACTVVVVRPHSEERARIPARVVQVTPQEGDFVLGLEFDRDQALLERLQRLVRPQPVPKARPANPYQELRAKPVAEQIKRAGKAGLSERVALERMRGKAVWEGLLKNPQVTIPEVARIARKGNLPRAALDLILANEAWLRAPPVRRALLSNPRLGSDAAAKVLRLLPKHELKLAEKQTAYPAAVRTQAARLRKKG